MLPSLKVSLSPWRRRRRPVQGLGLGFIWGLGLRVSGLAFSSLWLVRNEGREKHTETHILGGYVGCNTGIMFPIPYCQADSFRFGVLGVGSLCFLSRADGVGTECWA